MSNTGMRSQPVQVYVWDSFVRLFHWTLVISTTVAFLTEDDLLTVHVWAGYLVGVLVAARLLWGVIGPRHARFSDFIYRPSVTLQYARDFVLLRAKRHLGHSPGGGAMVALLLLLLSLTVFTGLMVYGGDQQAGPLAGILTKKAGEQLEEVHELLANVTLACIIVHVAAVVLVSVLHRENLVRSMITGYKRS